MVEHLSFINESFEGETRRTRCFLHTDNLAAKSAMRLFDCPKPKAGTAVRDLASQMADDLDFLAKDLEVETDDILVAGDVLLDEDLTESAEEGVGERNNDNEIQEDDVDGLDEEEDMSEEDRVERDKTVKPLKDVLFKVSV